MPWNLNGNPNINQNHFLGTNNNQPLRIRTNTNANGQDAMTITPAPTATTTGNVGIGTRTPSARLSVVAPGATEIGGTTRSSTLVTSAGSLGGMHASELALASIGFHSENSTSLGIRAYRYIGGAWEWTSIGLGMDVDNTKRAGASIWLHGNRGVSIGTERTHETHGFPVSPIKLYVAQEDPFNEPGDPQTIAILGEANDIGVRGKAEITGVMGEADTGVVGRGRVGVLGESTGTHPTGKAGLFRGPVSVSGHLTVENRVSVSGRLTVAAGSRVGIGTDNPGVLLHVQGQNRIRLDAGDGRTLDLRSDGAALDIESNGSDDAGNLFINGNNRKVFIPNLDANLVESSSRILKENIANFTIEEAIEALDGLKPISFNRKDDEEKMMRLGFVAEDTPEIATTPDKTAIVPTHILAILSNVVQEQQRMITSMRRALGLQSSA